MKKLKIEDAIGFVLAHDLTRIIPGVEKGPLFKMGHRITAEDIPLLLDIGKKHVFVLDENEQGIHENEAALRISRAVAGKNLQISEPSEGKVNLTATVAGVLRIREDLLLQLLEDPEICFSTALPLLPCQKGDLVASCRIIPLIKASDSLDELEERFAGQEPLIDIAPYEKQKVGLVVTGSEISEGRIQDAFGPRLMIRNQGFGAQILGISYPGDEEEEIKKQILNFIDQGATMVQLSGGMSVDPDDSTKFAIQAVCDETVVYGTSVLPGAMFMLAYRGAIPVVGLPAGVVAAPSSIFDLTIPRLFTGERLTVSDFRNMALGGLLAARK